MSDTPETDAKFGGKCATDAGYWSVLDLCRRMERERDEARAERDKYWASIIQIDEITKNAGMKEDAK